MRVITLLILLLSVGTAHSFEMTGKFAYEHDIAMMGYFQEADCLVDGGKWEAEMEFCFFTATDEITITNKEEGKFLVEAMTWGHNAHSCTFEGEATAESDVVLKAVAEGYLFGEDREEDCVVTITFSEEGKKATMESTQSCQTYCGMRAWLYTEATRL
ncbi:MAG: hypothetical protein EP326_01830 [Deltaproteobacteria bacterium]|nr:MAG: hypothetical protein EP326_01830 [Deltaproteobacteria bacterium]